MSVQFSIDQAGFHRAMATYAMRRNKTDADVVNKAMRYLLPFAAKRVKDKTPPERRILNALLVKDETLTIHATKSEFTSVPVTGDEIKLGATLATARSLRVDSVRTTNVFPNYEIELLDPNLATTAAAG